MHDFIITGPQYAPAALCRSPAAPSPLPPPLLPAAVRFPCPVPAASVCEGCIAKRGGPGGKHVNMPRWQTRKHTPLLEASWSRFTGLWRHLGALEPCCKLNKFRKDPDKIEFQCSYTIQMRSSTKKKHSYDVKTMIISVFMHNISAFARPRWRGQAKKITRRCKKT